MDTMINNFVQIYARIGIPIVIDVPSLEIRLTLTEVKGSGKNKLGSFRIKGSPILENGIQELTQNDDANLAEKLSVRVADHSIGTGLNLKFYNPNQYRICDKYQL